MSDGWLGRPLDENATTWSGFVDAATQTTHGLTHWAPSVLCSGPELPAAKTLTMPASYARLNAIDCGSAGL